MKVRSIVLAALLAVSASAAWSASGITRRDREEHACYNDAMTLCRDFVPNEAKVQACMESKRAQLSPECAALFGSDDSK